VNSTGSSRRERVRAATLDEILSVARELLVKEGAAAVTLRAIAREMGMTAPALYRYFPSLEELLAALCAALYHDVSDHLEQARDALPEDDPGTRLSAVCVAFRAWSVGHPAEFGLMFGSPLPDLGTDPQERPAYVAGLRFAGVFGGLFAQLWQRAPFPAPDADEIEPDLRTELERYLAELDLPLPVGAVQVFLSCWIRLYGMVTMEVFGHLNFAFSDVEPMFLAELADLGRRLGVAPS